MKSTKKKTINKPKKKISKKPTKTSKQPTKKTKRKTTVKKPKPNIERTKASKDGMNEFEQCIVLAAIVNQQRNADTRFLFTPLPDINSSTLAPLRQLLSKYAFTSNDIPKAAHEVFNSKKFKECFALHEPVKEATLKLTSTNNKNLITEIFALAGPEVKKWIYMVGEDPHHIHRTTLEKHAYKLGLLELQTMAQDHFQKQEAHKKIVVKLNLQNKDSNWHHSMRFSGKQHRGRG